MRCVAIAWERHRSELHRFLRDRAGCAADADDLLQEVFLRAQRQPDGLCGIDQPRAWLFQTARNLLVDRLRLAKDQVQLPDDLAAEPEPAVAPVDRLAQCLPRVLAELSPPDREAITLCDIEGLTQQAYADRLGLTLAAVKARVRRARQRLRVRLVRVCQVSFDEAGRVGSFVHRPPR